MSKWIGKGILKLKTGKKIRYGEEMPKDFDKERLKKFKKNGKIGEIIVNTTKTVQESDSFKSKIEKLKEEKKELVLKIDELEKVISEDDSATENSKLTEENEELKKEIKDLKDLLEEATAVPSGVEEK